MENKFELGSRLRDVVTGFEGTATAVVKYLNGCVQYCIVPKVKEDGNMPNGEYIDVDRLEFVSEKQSIRRENQGGIMRIVPMFKHIKHLNK